jgi:hypothetical protein
MFGEVSFELESVGDSKAVLRLTTEFGARAPEHLFVHLPWFEEVRSVKVDGRAVQPVDGMVEVPVGAKVVEFVWNRRPGTPGMSYASAVKAYESEYAQHYAEYLRTGVPFAR